jgi:L-fuculokinase
MRAEKFKPSGYTYENGLIFESDADRGMWNPQLLMMGSGVLEWVRKHLYSACSNRSNVYDIMISEAEKVKQGSGDAVFVPNFVMGTGPLQKYGVPGMITGLTLGTTRGEVYRSALEGLSFQLKRAIEVMKKSTGFSPAGIRVAGGGAKNGLWNRIRADVAGLPVIITAQKEITALGAALNCFVKRGVYGSMKEALENVDFEEEVTYPSKHAKDYVKPYGKFLELHELYGKNKS